MGFLIPIAETYACGSTDVAELLGSWGQQGGLEITPAACL